MVNIEIYISQLITLLQQQFDNRLLYVGLQGSYLRGEATEHSDLDIMVVIDKLTAADLDHYRSIIQSMDHYEKSCGFICSKADLANWNPLEIWNLLNGTKDYFGELSNLVPAYTEEDIRVFTKLSINNLYHELCHRYIHASESQNIAALPGTYKGVFFIQQHLSYLKHGIYTPTKAELLNLLVEKDRTVLERSIALSKGITFDFTDSFNLLFTWCQETLESL